MTAAFLPVLLLLATFGVARSHANLERSEPAANAVLAAAPADVRLWFSEPVEPKFSGLELHDSAGAIVATGSQVDPADAHQMFLPLQDLAGGVYTVVWWNTSSADGHSEKGNFPFTVGAAPFQPPLATPVDGVSHNMQAISSGVPLAGLLVRWFNLLSLALITGTLSFACLVWQAAVKEHVPAVERRVSIITWLGWLALGLAGVLILLNQISTMAGVPLVKSWQYPAVGAVLTSARFGALWLVRMALWLLMGVCLWIAGARPRWRWVALACAVLILLLTSLFSHSAATQDRSLGVVGDFVHLTLASFWVGGLIMFLAIIGPARHALQPPAAQIGRLAHFFSACARIAVAGLLITGLYAAWVLVASFDGLTTTLYGRLLLIKLLLLFPLLCIAALNLLWVQQRLLANLPVWITRLRGLIAAEIALLTVIMAIVAGMTSINPARSVIAQRDQAAESAAPTPPATIPPALNQISMTQVVEDLSIGLLIMPGYVGNNEFRVTLDTSGGQRVTDASLIRLRFTNLMENLGESELRIEQGQQGTYAVDGANLSAPGHWRIRMSVQRPDAYDSVVDFEPHVEPPPPPPTPAPVPSPEAVTNSGDEVLLPWRTPALLITGIFALTVGSFALAQQRFRFWIGAGVLSFLLIMLGIVFVAGALIE